MERATPDVNVLREAGAKAIAAEADTRIRAADLNNCIAIKIRFSYYIYAKVGSVGYADIDDA
jgi:hypothetical protein